MSVVRTARRTLEPHLETTDADLVLRWDGNQLEVVPRSAVRQMPYPERAATHGVFIPIRRWVREVRHEARKERRRNPGFTVRVEADRRKAILKQPRRAEVMNHA